MNLRQLEIFCAVMRCRTTIAAAYELGVSQPAVSNAIKHLEAQLGLPLFERAGNRLVPTIEAAALYRDAEPLHAMSQGIMRKVCDLRDTKLGHIRVLCTQALSRAFVAEALSRFLRNRENVKVFFDVRRMEGVVEGVESGFADLGIALNPARRPGMEVQPILEGRMVVALPESHPLAKCMVIVPADLEGHSVIGLEPASRLGSLVSQSFDSAGISYRPMIEVRHCVTACSLVEQGLGIAVVDEFSAGHKGKWDFVVRPLDPPVNVQASIIYLKGRRLSRLASRLIHQLVSDAKFAAMGGSPMDSDFGSCAAS